MKHLNVAPDWKEYFSIFDLLFSRKCTLVFLFLKFLKIKLTDFFFFKELKPLISLGLKMENSRLMDKYTFNTKCCNLKFLIRKNCILSAQRVRIYCFTLLLPIICHQT